MSDKTKNKRPLDNFALKALSEETLKIREKLADGFCIWHERRVGFQR